MDARVDSPIDSPSPRKSENHSHKFSQPAPDVSATYLARQTIELALYVAVGTVHCLYRLTQVHVEAYCTIFCLWIPFVGIQLCRFVLSLLRMHTNRQQPE